MTDEEKIRKAQHAERLLSDDLLKEAISKLRESAIEKFRSASATDVNALQAARSYQDAADQFEQNLKTIITDGKIAKRNAELKKPTAAKR